MFPGLPNFKVNPGPLLERAFLEKPFRG